MLERLRANQVVVLGSVAIFSVGLVLSGYLLGDGLRRAKMAERTVSVRGVAERDVIADLATWTVSFSEEGSTLAPVQATVDDESRKVRSFFARSGFGSGEITDSGISASEIYDRDRNQDRVTVSRSIQLRSRDVMKVRAAHERQADLIRDGVALNGSNVIYSYTKLNDIKPAMIAEANRGARLNAEQFARDSGASVGRIKTASQGYFSVGARDGDVSEDGGSSGSGSPLQKVRVVTTVDYDID